MGKKSAKNQTVAPVASTTESVVITKAPIINQVIDAAVVEKVIEKKHIEIHKQDVITEVHEQPIIEIHGNV